MRYKRFQGHGAQIAICYANCARNSRPEISPGRDRAGCGLSQHVGLRLPGGGLSDLYKLTWAKEHLLSGRFATKASTGLAA